MHDLHYIKRPKLTDNEIFEIVRKRGGAWVISRPVGGIGDAVMILPSITALKKQVGDDLVIVSCVDYVEPIFSHNPYVDYIMSYDGDEISQGIQKQSLAILRDLDCIIYKLYSPDPAALYEAQNEPYIIKSRQDVWCEYCDVEFDTNNYCLYLDKHEKNARKELGINDRYVIVQLRSHDGWRDYPKVLTNTLLYDLVKLGKKLDFEVVAIDSTQESSIKKVRSLHHMHLDVVLGVLHGAMMLIGPDSMGVHVKGALGNGSVYGIFGPTNPSVRLKYPNAYWNEPHKRCKRQYCWYHPCKFRLCLSSLRPGKIVNSVSDILVGRSVENVETIFAEEQ